MNRLPPPCEIGPLTKGAPDAITLPAGYLGSSFIGALLIFCGFVSSPFWT